MNRSTACRMFTIVMPVIWLGGMTNGNWAIVDKVAKKEISSYVSDEKVQASKWDEKADFPPLPPRLAIAAANKEVQRISGLLPLRGSKLVFRRLSLEDVNGLGSWAWVVEYKRIEGVAIDFDESVRIIVLMTSEVIRPKVEDM